MAENGLTAADIIRAALPDASDQLCDFILWGRTPFPALLTPRILYRAADRYRRATANGRQLCEWCDNETQPDVDMCPRCRGALDSVRNMTTEPLA